MAGRYEVKTVLKSLLKVAEDPDNREFSAADLEQHGIRFSTFNLSDKASPICRPWAQESLQEALRQIPPTRKPAQPRFEDPNLRDESDSDDDNGPIFPYWKALACEAYLTRYFELFCGISSQQRPWRSYHGDASELYLVEAWLRYDERWSTSTLFQVKDHAQDHLACTLVDEREATKPLSRAELYSLLSLIQQGLKRSKSARNIPAMVYSIAITKTRIIQADFKGTTLHIRISEWIDINGAKEEEIQQFARWMLNEPVGAQKDEGDQPDIWDEKRHWMPLVGWY